MTRTIVIILCISLYGFAKAQTSFSKTYEDFGGNVGTSVLVEPNGYVICGMGYGDTTHNRVVIKLFKTDLQGGLLQCKHFGSKDYRYSPGTAGSLVSVNGGYALGGTLRDSSNFSHPILFKFDKNRDSAFVKQLSQASGSSTRCRQPFKTSYVLINSVYTSNKEYEIQICKTDTFGNIQWTRNFGGLWDDFGETIELTQDGGFILGGTIQIDEFRTTKSYIVKTDSSGQKIWDKEYSGSRNCDGGVSLSADGGYYLWGCLDTIINIGDQFSAVFIIKTNSLGEKIWEKYFNSPYVTSLSQVRELNDGTVMLIGAKDQPSSFYDGGWIVKLDHNGTIIWERIHAYYQTDLNRFDYCNLVDFQPVDDGLVLTGGCLVDTDTLGNYRQDMWLLKLDENGCLNGDCGLLTDIEETEKETEKVKLYPNPANNQLIIETQSPTGTFTLYDITGKKQLQQPLTQPKTIIDITHLPTGLYLYEAGHARGKVQVVR